MEKRVVFLVASLVINLTNFLKGWGLFAPTLCLLQTNNLNWYMEDNSIYIHTFPALPQIQGGLEYSQLPSESHKNPESLSGLDKQYLLQAHSGNFITLAMQTLLNSNLMVRNSWW